MSERNPLHTEVRVDDEVSGQHLSRHDLANLGIDDLLPGVGSVGHYESKIEAKLLNYLPLHRHDLLDRKLVH